MADEVLVKTASVSLSPAIPTVNIDVDSHTLALAPSAPFTSSESNELLLESDIEASFAGYVTPYDNLPFDDTPGVIIFQSLKSVSALSEFVKKNGDAIALATTEGTITCMVSVPAVNTKPPSPVPDTNLTYDLDFTISDPGQTLTVSD